jgi:hypothetical protein
MSRAGVGLVIKGYSQIETFAFDLRWTRSKPSPSCFFEARSHQRRDRSPVPDECRSVVPRRQHERRTAALTTAAQQTRELGDVGSH